MEADQAEYPEPYDEIRRLIQNEYIRPIIKEMCEQIVRRYEAVEVIKEQPFFL